MKEVLAYREIKKENNIKKSAIILEVLLVVLLICAIICLINPTGEEGINILGYILMGMAVLYVFIIYFVLKAAEKVKRINSYPREAIVYENGYFFIYDDTIKQIRVEDVKKVKGQKDTISGPHVTIVKKTGSIKIITDNEKYKVEQLEDVDASLALIKKYIKK
ncbi:MAG: hypothetical protein IKJ30_03605 [Bacilli bacterium]|nr:hypothetical protein [Bacilli bacterium]